MRHVVSCRPSEDYWHHLIQPSSSTSCYARVYYTAAHGNARFARKWRSNPPSFGRRIGVEILSNIINISVTDTIHIIEQTFFMLSTSTLRQVIHLKGKFCRNVRSERNTCAEMWPSIALVLCSPILLGNDAQKPHSTTRNQWVLRLGVKCGKIN